jgi:hypothetical protein
VLLCKPKGEGWEEEHTNKPLSSVSLLFPPEVDKLDMQNSYICSQKFVEKERWMTMIAPKRREGSGARSIQN